MNRRLLDVAALCQKKELPAESENPKEYDDQMLNQIAIGLVKTILSNGNTS